MDIAPKSPILIGILHYKPSSWRVSLFMETPIYAYEPLLAIINHYQWLLTTITVITINHC